MSALPSFEDDPLAYIKNLDRLFDEAAIGPARFKVQSAAKFVDPTHNDDPFEERQPEQSKFAPIAADDFAAGSLEVNWLIKGVLPRAELAIIYGESSSGKSFLTLDMCASLARGVPFGEHKITRKHRIAYVAAEGRDGFKRRVRAIKQAKKISLPGLDIIPECPLFLNSKDPLALIEQLQPHGKYDVVVLDTLSSIAPGSNENSSEGMGAVLGHCKKVHELTGALVILIHHAGKDASKGARGWSGGRAAADCEIEVTRDGDTRTWKLSKSRDGADSQVFSFKLGVEDLGPDSDGEPTSSCYVTHIETAKIISKPALPAGEYEEAADKVLGNDQMELDDVYRAMLEILPAARNGKRDQRKTPSREAVKRLISKGLWKLVEGSSGERVQRRVIELKEEWT